MNAALLSLALLGTPLLTPVSDRFPQLNVEALCKGRSAADKFMKLPESQSVADCVRDETDARQRLGPVWGSASLSIRARCQSEAAELGTRSYLDLLTCIQMAEDIKSQSTPSPTKGMSKNRSTK